MHRADENPQGIKSPLPSSPQSMPDGNWGLHTTCLVHGLPGFSHGTELQLPKSDLWLPSLSCLPFSVFPGIASPTNYLHLIPGFRTAYGRIWTKTVIFLNFFLIGGKLLYNVVMVSAARQCKSAIIIHMSPLPWASHSPSIPVPWIITEHLARLPVWDGNFSPAICLTHDSVCMSVLPAPLVSLLPALCARVSNCVSTSESHLPFTPAVSYEAFSSAFWLCFVELMLICS